MKNAFLHGILTETVTVYCSQPTGFENSTHPGFICRLNKSMYGLKQAPRAWYSRFATFLLTLGLVESEADTSLSFVVDLTQRICSSTWMISSSPTPLRAFDNALIGSLQQFSKKELGQLLHFLGMHVQRQ